VRFEQLLGAQRPLRENLLRAQHCGGRAGGGSFLLPILTIQECLTVDQDFVIVPDAIGTLLGAQ
jgi:hypothetical protein